MNWRRLTLSVGARDVEPASGLLSTFGNVAVTTDGRPEPRSLISVYVPARSARGATFALHRTLARARGRGLLRSARLSAATVCDEDWSTSWKRFYRPARVSPGLFVVPSWRRDFVVPPSARAIYLDPGMAFGTGQHATTKMALGLLVPRVHRGDVVLDVGCGSGILGIAAAQRGARVYLSDFDPIAVAAARKNFRENGLRAAVVRRASGVPASFPRAHAIVANITADVLTALAPAFARKVRRGGILVTGGVTARGRTALLAAFARAGFELDDEHKSGEWRAFAHRKAA